MQTELLTFCLIDHRDKKTGKIVTHIKYVLDSRESIIDRELTKEQIERIDHRGNLLDFIFCSNCVSFIYIENKKVGDEITRINCHTDKYFL